MKSTALSLEQRQQLILDAYFGASSQKHQRNITQSTTHIEHTQIKQEQPEQASSAKVFDERKDVYANLVRTHSISRARQASREERKSRNFSGCVDVGYGEV